MLRQPDAPSCGEMGHMSVWFTQLFWHFCFPGTGRRYLGIYPRPSNASLETCYLKTYLHSTGAMQPSPGAIHGAHITFCCHFCSFYPLVLFSARFMWQELRPPTVSEFPVPCRLYWVPAGSVSPCCCLRFEHSGDVMGMAWDGSPSAAASCRGCGRTDMP